MAAAQRATVVGVFALTLLGVAVLPATAHGDFWDDDGNTHEAQIEAIEDERITRGCNPPLNDQYCPNFEVPRDQMAAFLARALDLPPAQEDHFGDDDGNLFEDDINRIAEAGITKGCNPPENDRYCPDMDIPRDQMAAFLDRAFVDQESDRDFFVDDDGNMFEHHINNIAEAGITRGCNPPENDRYCPDMDVPRDQMAAFLARALDLSVQHPGPASYDRVIHYSWGEIGNPDRGSVDILGTRAHQALHSLVTMGQEGWNIQGRIYFVPVRSGGDVHIWLADDAYIGSISGCSSSYSCTVGDDVYINDENFVDATATYRNDGRSLPEYQRYVINHEMGHWLNFDRAPGGDEVHYNDDGWCRDEDGDGVPEAPVMMQQSIDTQGCDTNVWPLEFERDCVEEARLSEDRTTQDEECPHDPVER